MAAVRAGDTLVVTKPDRLARSLPTPRTSRRAHHGAGSFGLHAGSDMLVGVDGERRAPVTEPFRQALNGRLALRSRVPVGLAGVVESDHTLASSGWNRTLWPDTEVGR